MPSATRARQNDRMTDTSVAAVEEPPAPTPTRRRGRWPRLNYLGLVGATLAVGLSLTPSLLPRPWPFQGFIAGFGAAIGYGLGTLLSAALRHLIRREPGRSVKRAAWRGLAVLGPLLWVLFVVLGGIWQDQVRELVGEEPNQAVFSPGVAVIIVVVGLATLFVCRGIRLVTRWIIRLLGRVIPARLAQAVGFVAVAVLIYWLAAGVLFNAFVDAADRVYSASNAETTPGVTAPTSPDRSGSPESLVPWSTLGRQGRNFVATGPTTAQLTAFSGQPATEPIRVYVGLDSAPSARSRADLAVRELERTGAFQRPVLVVAGATGTGWLEPQSVDSLEYMWNGNTAIATIQYSYLPSWISFLVDQQRAADAGRELFDAVYARWQTLPADTRPKLISYGLSLGSFAAQSAFGSAGDLAARTDGALFMGTPNFAQPWGDITRTRDAGSPEWQPIYREGQSLRFGATVDNLANPAGPWPWPHIVFMQHASDPVVWWSFDLLTRRPDWLAEPRGPDVSSKTRWYPFVTFMQVTVDQFFGVSVPLGHGHNYGNTIVGAWQNVVPPPQWTPAAAAQLQQMIDAYPLD